MRLPDILLLSLSVVFVIIGVHQIMTVGFGNAYWAIMLSLLFLFLFNFRKRKQRQ
jgi:hypothetical protein